MDDFLEPFWDLEQVFAWAETRRPDAVFFAAAPKHRRAYGHKEIVGWCSDHTAYLAQEKVEI